MGNLTVADVEKAVESIRREISDPEAAHGTEDRLYADVLQSIANGTCSDPAGCARAALKSCEIEFPRWCA